MINLKITYKGKSYNSISDALTKAIVDGIKESFEKSLRPFSSEIKASGGSVIVDIPEDMENMNIKFNNMPQDLIDKIMKVL